MADAPVKIDSKGARLASVLTGTAQVIDLTAYARRWLKVYADQDFYYFMAEGASLSTYAFNLSGAAAVGTVGIPFECALGATGVPVLVDPKTPFLHVRAKTATAAVTIKPTSDAQTSE